MRFHLKEKLKRQFLLFVLKELTLKRILELYLNQIYLGEGTYGVAAASLEYFDKSVKDLNYLESAMLAALPKAQVDIIRLNIQIKLSLEEI